MGSVKLRRASCDEERKDSQCGVCVAYSFVPAAKTADFHRVTARLADSCEKALTFFVVALLFLLIPKQSWGIIALRPDLELEGFVQAENILRTPKFQGAHFIMQRNTAQIEGRYHFLQEGKAFGWLSTGPLEDATFTAIGRGVYDSIYDIGEHFSERVLFARERETQI